MTDHNYTQQAARFGDLLQNFVEPQEAFDLIQREMDEQGFDPEEIANITHDLEMEFFPDHSEMGQMDDAHDDMMAADSGHDLGDVPFEEDTGGVDDDQLLQAIAALFGPEIWEKDSMQDLAHALEVASPTPEELNYIISSGTLPTRLKGIKFDQGDSFQFDEDIQNGYNDVKFASGKDYFPDGADSPVVDATGPSGAHMGDNPEQKKMQVKETHTELVYAYRNYLKESAKK